MTVGTTIKLYPSFLARPAAQCSLRIRIEDSSTQKNRTTSMTAYTYFVLLTRQNSLSFHTGQILDDRLEIKGAAHYGINQ